MPLNEGLDEEIDARDEEVGWVANQIGFKEVETGTPISAWIT